MSMIINPHRFGVAAAPGVGDPHYANVAILLHGDGSDASVIFIDDSQTPYNPNTIAGNAQISTAQSVFGGASMKFDGTGDYLVYGSDTSRFEFGAEDFTIECRMRAAALSANQCLFEFRSAAVAEGWEFRLASNDHLIMPVGDSNTAAWEIVLDNGSALSADTWYAVAVERRGSTFRLYIDGAVADTKTWAGTIGYSGGSRSLTIGAWANFAGTFNGFLDELRITKGVARYVGAYTPATEAFPDRLGDPDYADVKLLLHFDGSDASTTFTDNSPTPYAPNTKAGNVQISTTQSKFGGASGKFDGTGDYLVYTSDTSRFYFASLDFCIEARVFISTTGREQVLVDFRGAWLDEGLALFLTTGNKLKFFAGDANSSAWEVTMESSGAAMSSSTWYSVAVSRIGSDFRLFVDGAIVATASWAGGIAYSATPRLTVGNWFDTSYGGDFAGYIDELRITLGAGRYAADYGPAGSAFPNSA